MELKDRFLKYVSFDTQSDEASETFPSTSKQLVLLNYLADEMRAMGMSHVEVDEHGYVMGSIPATVGYENSPVIGFISHVDTSPDMSGCNIHPMVVDDYDGKDVVLNPNCTLHIKDFPEVALLKGHTVIFTDGTTLLGADDKAGVSEIMTAAEYLLRHPELPHGVIKIGFTPDEEVGRGVKFFNVKKFGADFAYTMDGSAEGELEYENFNAASVEVKIHGSNIHPGYAKNKMLNALQLACEFNSLLPVAERPEYTEGYEGFYHLVELNGSVEAAHLSYILRDHSKEKFLQRKQFVENVTSFMAKKYGEHVFETIIKDSYYNMREMVEPHPEVIQMAVDAMKMAGVQPVVKPIRGGTDGANLSYMGLPCPNIFTGGLNFHGKYECCSLNVMQKAVDVIINICRIGGDNFAK